MGLADRFRALRVTLAAVQDAGANADGFLDNDDLRPLALKHRTWTTWTYLTFWFSATATVANWYGASAAQGLGLSMWESLLCQLGGQMLIAVVITLNGRPGAVYRIGFPIVSRAAFGVYGAWWPTMNRAAMAIVWNGVNTVQGGQCVYVMLHAIFPGIANVKNTLSGSAIETAQLVGVLIFWLMTCLLLVIPVPKMRVLVYAKLAVFVVSAVSMLAWTVTKAGGLGPVVRQGGTAAGSRRTWLLVRFLLLGAANCATFASNAADFQRYARRPSDVLLGNMFGFPLANMLVALVGNLVCASSQRLFGELVWNPVELLDRIQKNDYSAGNRAGCFFIAACFSYSAVFSCIFENSLPAGNDLAALVPKFVTVQRGFFICAVLSLVLQPWYLLGSAVIFVEFLASYQIFLSAITGVLLANYYIICKGRICIHDCFIADKDAVYHYTHGWNTRAYAAYILGIVPNFYGFLNNMGVQAPVSVTRFYYFAYWVGLFVSALVFWLLCLIWPPAAIVERGPGWKEPKDYVRPEEESRIQLPQIPVQGIMFRSMMHGEEDEWPSRAGPLKKTKIDKESGCWEGKATGRLFEPMD